MKVRTGGRHSWRTPVVIGFDPGGTTGYCVIDTEGHVRAQGQFEGDDAAQTRQCRALLKGYRNVLMVLIEAYRIYPSALQAHTFSAVQPVQIIGRIKMLCEEFGFEYKEQMAGLVKPFFTTPRLKWYGAYIPKATHPNDAARHVLYWMVFTAKILGLPRE